VCRCVCVCVCVGCVYVQSMNVCTTNSAGWQAVVRAPSSPSRRPSRRPGRLAARRRTEFASTAGLRTGCRRPLRAGSYGRCIDAACWSPKRKAQCSDSSPPEPDLPVRTICGCDAPSRIGPGGWAQRPHISQLAIAHRQRGGVGGRVRPRPAPRLPTGPLASTAAARVGEESGRGRGATGREWRSGERASEKFQVRRVRRRVLNARPHNRPISTRPCYSPVTPDPAGGHRNSPRRGYWPVCCAQPPFGISGSGGWWGVGRAVIRRDAQRWDDADCSELSGERPRQWWPSAGTSEAR